MKLPGFSKVLLPQERLAAILAVGVAVISVMYMLPEAGESVASQSLAKPVESAVADVHKPAMPFGYNPGVKVKDPFVAAPEYVPPTTAMQAAMAESNPLQRTNNILYKQANQTLKSKPQVPDIKLTGVAGNENNRLAIIKFGDKSQSYALQEAVGPYRLVAIHQDSAVLDGPDGQKVIWLGR